jgi:hypothetical protein
MRHLGTISQMATSALQFVSALGSDTHGPGTSRPFASASRCYHLWSLRFRRRDRALTAGPGCHGSSSTEMGAPGTSTTAVRSTSNQHSPRARIVSRVGVMSRFRMKPSLLLSYVSERLSTQSQNPCDVRLPCELLWPSFSLSVACSEMQSFFSL